MAALALDVVIARVRNGIVPGRAFGRVAQLTDGVTAFAETLRGSACLQSLPCAGMSCLIPLALYADVTVAAHGQLVSLIAVPQEAQGRRVRGLEKLAISENDLLIGASTEDRAKMKHPDIRHSWL